MVSKKNRNFTFKIVVFGGFKNDNILSSKSYTITKSEISPQGKLGYLQNLKLKLIRHLLTIKKISWRSVHRCAHTSCKRAHSRWNVCVRVCNSYARIYATIFMKIVLVVSWCFMNLSFKFCKDPSCCWGDILLYLTVLI